MNPLKETALNAAHCDRADLTEEEVMEMRRLLERHFEGVDERQFTADMREKTHVLRVWKGSELVGFSTLLAYRTMIGDEALDIIYSGDTIMSPTCWNSPVLARGWIAMVREVKASMSAGRCWWLLLSAGFRTYRFLPVFWREFWPRFDMELPDGVRILRDSICRERFGQCYDSESGVVRFALPHRLKDALAKVPDGRGDDPHVACFFQRNPGWRDGDELACLTEIDDENLTRAGRRMIRGL